MHLVYLCGAPAAGKSSLMAALTADCQRLEQPAPFRHDALHRSGEILGCELGAIRKDYSGTDALPMNVQPKAVNWLGKQFYRLVLGEGQRLGNPGFLAQARSAGYETTAVHLVTTETVLKARRSARGSTQNCSWAKGASTQAANLAAAERTAGQHVVELDASLPLEELVKLLHRQVQALEVLG